MYLICVGSILRMTLYIDLIGVSVGFGTDRHSVDIGPSTICYAGLRQGLSTIDHQVHDH